MVEGVEGGWGGVPEICDFLVNVGGLGGLGFEGDLEDGLAREVRGLDYVLVPFLARDVFVDFSLDRIVVLSICVMPIVINK